jgi:NADPH:quinone reductase
VLTEFVAFKPGQSVLAPGIGGAVGMESVQVAASSADRSRFPPPALAKLSAKAEKAHAGGYEHVIDPSRESLRDGVMRLPGGRGWTSLSMVWAERSRAGRLVTCFSQGRMRWSATLAVARRASTSITGKEPLLGLFHRPPGAWDLQ